MSPLRDSGFHSAKGYQVPTEDAASQLAEKVNRKIVEIANRKAEEDRKKAEGPGYAAKRCTLGQAGQTPPR